MSVITDHCCWKINRDKDSLFFNMNGEWVIQMIQQETGRDILPVRLEVRCWHYTPISLFSTQGNSVILGICHIFTWSVTSVKILLKQSSLTISHCFSVISVIRFPADSLSRTGFSGLGIPGNYGYCNYFCYCMQGQAAHHCLQYLPI